LTESVAGSLLLITIGAALRSLCGGTVSRHTLLLLAGSGVLAVQIRGSAGPIVLGVVAVLLLAAPGWGARLRIICAGGAVAASVLLFPAYRWAVTGAFFTPNIDYVTLSIALGINPRPTDDAVRKLKAFPLPSNLPAETISARGLTFQEAADLGAHLRSLGYGVDAARSVVKQMAWIIRTDSPGIILNQARLALLSVGTEYLALAGDEKDEFYRGYTLQQFRDHVKYYRNWFSWTMAENYEPIFEQFFEMYRKTPETIDEHVRQELRRFLHPFFVTRQAAARDPLRLSRVPFEVWIGGWLLAVASRRRKDVAVGVLLVTPVMLNYVVSLSAGLARSSVFAESAALVYCGRCVVLVRRDRRVLGADVRFEN
jgi:hypothetical protein